MKSFPLTEMTFLDDYVVSVMVCALINDFRKVDIDLTMSGSMRNKFSRSDWRIDPQEIHSEVTVKLEKHQRGCVETDQCIESSVPYNRLPCQVLLLDKGTHVTLGGSSGTKQHHQQCCSPPAQRQRCYL